MWSLQEQISLAKGALERYLEAVREQERESARRLEGNRADHRVVVVGHSVGAYIGLEVVRRLRAEARERWSEGRFIGGKKGEEVKIVGYVGLWPTVTWIGRSRMGRKIGVSFILFWMSFGRRRASGSGGRDFELMLLFMLSIIHANAVDSVVAVQTPALRGPDRVAS